MPRNYLGISTRGPTVLRNLRADSTREPLFLLDQDAVDKIQINYADWLDAGETIASVSATGEGVTVAPSLATPNLTLQVSGSTHEGRITILATTNLAQVHRQVIRVRRTIRTDAEDEILGDYA